MSTDDKKPLGRILLRQKLISQRELESALREQQQSPQTAKPLASVLAASGIVTEIDALRALSEQYGVPGIDLTQLVLPLEYLDVIPDDFASNNKVLPVLVREGQIFLAMADPRDTRTIDELEFMSGSKIYAYVALATTLNKTIREAYDAKTKGRSHYLGTNAPTDQTAALNTPPEAPQHAPSTFPPDAPPVVLDDAMLRASVDAEMSTADFGTLGSDISTVAELPDELRVPIEATEHDERRETPNGKLILVVDDEEDIRRLLHRLFTEKGHRVIEADRGILALRLVKEHVPDLIVLDAMLPEIHGFDIARRIKGSKRYGDIPIVVISAVYRGWRIAEDLKTSYGIEEYIEKPFRLAHVLSVVTRALAMREGQRSRLPSHRPEAMSQEAEDALKEGISAYEAGDLEGAITHLTHGVAVDPLAYRLHFHLALLYGKKGLIYDGISELEKAIDLQPKHFAALKNLAIFYEKAGFRHKATELWERCIHAAPDPETRTKIKQHLIRLL